MLSHGRILVAALVGLGALGDAVRPAPGQTVEAWLARHKPADFTGRVWVRCSIAAPKKLEYAVIIDSETNPYGPMRQATGTVWSSGLKPKTWEGDADWGKPLAWIEPATPADWIKAGQLSAWVDLPRSTAPQWHTAFFVRTKGGKPAAGLRLQLEFASAADQAAIFNRAAETLDDAGVATARMPTEGGEAGLRMVQTFGQWARKRAQRVESLGLGPPPRLDRLRINTYAQLFSYRNHGGNAPLDRAQCDFRNFEQLGINSLGLSGVADKDFRALAARHHVRYCVRTVWADFWQYTTQAYQHQYDFRPGETPDQRWARVFDDFYQKQAAHDQKNSPFAFSIGDHINLGDEVGPVVTPAKINETPAFLAALREYLKQQRLEPRDLGVGHWEAVRPTDDRARLGPSPTVAQARLFYFTRRFIDQQTAIYYRHATAAVRKYYPHARLITVNFQAGPIQASFIGNTNDLNRGQLDLFELGRSGYYGAMSEDWVNGTADFGIGRIAMGAQILESAARKQRAPTASYVVGGEAIRAEMMANLMHGVKELVLYLYGPIRNIGPTWSEDPRTLTQLGQLTRELAPIEGLIADARPRAAKVALLVSSTSDIMQVKGLYSCAERQQVYLALAHSGVPVDIVCEQEIIEDDILDRYAVLYLVDPQAPSDVLKKIAAWVYAGGHLWASVGAGSWDEFSQPSSILDPVFGVKDRSMVTQPDWLKPAGALWQTNVSRFDFKAVDELRFGGVTLSVAQTSPRPSPGETGIAVWGARLKCKPASAKIVGKYASGEPAVLINKYGRGEALLVGALAGEAYARAHYPQGGQGAGRDFTLGARERRLVTDILTRWKVVPPLELSTPGIYISVMDAPSATLVFLNNASGAPIKKLRVTVRENTPAKNVKSAKLGSVKHAPSAKGLRFELPLADTDIVVVEHTE